ncbi:MAG: hypothetical protein ABFS28_05695 [Bacteroidota bacterium]
MKKRIFFSLLLTFSTLAFVAAQDLDEILDTYFETIGQEKILEVKTMEASGKVVMMGAEGEFRTISKKPDKIRVEVQVMGNTIIQAYDGTNAWAINPMSGSADPIDMTGPEADGMIETSDMEGLLWNYEEKGHQLELEGSEEVDGSEAFVLKLTKQNGNIDYYYIDSENYVILKVKSKVIMNGSEIEVEALMSNYQEVDGYLGAFTTEQRYNGQTGLTIQLSEIKYDVEVDDAIFVKPAVSLQ